MQPAILCAAAFCPATTISAAFVAATTISAAAKDGLEWILSGRFLCTAAAQDGFVWNLWRSFWLASPNLAANASPCTSSSKLHQNRDNLLISSSTPEFTKTAISCFNGRCIKHLPLPLSRNRRARANKRLCKYLHFVPTHPSPLPPYTHTLYSY